MLWLVLYGEFPQIRDQNNLSGIPSDLSWYIYVTIELKWFEISFENKFR